MTIRECQVQGREDGSGSRPLSLSLSLHIARHEATSFGIGYSNFIEQTHLDSLALLNPSGKSHHFNIIASAKCKVTTLILHEVVLPTTCLHLYCSTIRYLVILNSNKSIIFVCYFKFKHLHCT